MVMVVERANKEYVRALARAFSAVDNHGVEEDWQLWLPMATALYEMLPHDYAMVGLAEIKILQGNKAATDPQRVAILAKIVKAVRRLLLDFLDPRDRAMALGTLAQCVTELDKYDFAHEETRGRR